MLRPRRSNEIVRLKKTKERGGTQFFQTERTVPRTAPAIDPPLNHGVILRRQDPCLKGDIALITTRMGDCPASHLPPECSSHR